MIKNQNDSLEQGFEKYFFRASPDDFKIISGAPIAYWVSEIARQCFKQHPRLSEFGETREGLTTGGNDLFLRLWHEVGFNGIGIGFESRQDAKSSQLKWFPYNKGGEVVKWYGNTDYLVYWHDDGQLLQTRQHPSGRIWAHNFNLDYIFREAVSWTAISNKGLGFRYFPKGFLFDANGLSFFPSNQKEIFTLISILNSSVGEYFAKIINSSMKFNAGDIGRIPINNKNKNADLLAERAIAITKLLWDSYETSWEFTRFPLVQPDHRQKTLEASYQKLRLHWREMTLEMQRLEEENNRIFIDAYGMQDELKPEVPLNEITLTCNPHYRYGGDKTEEELEAMLLADTMRELVSYAVGCMLGRYSLDKPGLILANQGEALADYLAQVPQPSFAADEDNVIPVLDGDWFADDITLRFRQFLRVAFGDAHYDENLAFIEQALNIKGKRNYSLRDYFLSEFYADHVKRYKKRPIYWLFSSPKGSFNALIYMHRYRPDTMSVVLKYLRDYREKLVTEKERQAAVSINPASSQGDKTKALKEVDRLGKVLAELEDYERDVLYPLATEQKQIDLDDGVKVNYLKFGAALKKIAGLEAKDED